MEDLEVLLSDKFADFSQAIQKIAWEKKKLKAEFKEVYDKFQADIKALDNEALEAQRDFEEWKSERARSTSDG